MLRASGAALAAFTALVLCAPRSARAEGHIYSYDPVSPAARTLAPTGLSFEFERHLMGGARVFRIIQTGERGAADVKPAPEVDGMKAVLASAKASGDLYEILPDGDGKAFVQAVCPGAERAWLLIGPLERFRDLTVQAVG